MLENGNPRIIYKKVNFSCFVGLVHGTIDAAVYDQGTKEFPTIITVDTNWGAGSISHSLTGNEQIKKEVNGINVEVNISNWKCDENELSFHVKGVGKKSIFSCTVIDENFRGVRLNAERYARAKAALISKIEAMA